MSAKEKEEKVVPVQAYSKAEMASFYRVTPGLFHKWLIAREKELKKLGYERQQKILTIAQVRFLFRDDQLGQP